MSRHAKSDACQPLDSPRTTRRTHFVFPKPAAGYYDLDEELRSADLLIDKEQCKQAIDKLKDAIKSDPDNADAWNLLGYASRKKGDLERSTEAYGNVLRIDPEHKDALEYQDELFLMLGDKAAAQVNLAKLTSLCPDGCEQIEELAKAIAAQD